MAEHGGLHDPPRHADLVAALGRPVSLNADSEAPPPLSRLAAAYGFALARGRCFPDGNKRVALAVVDVFLRLNGHALTEEEMDAVDTIQAIAAGEFAEEQLAEWIASHSSARELGEPRL